MTRLKKELDELEKELKELEKEEIPTQIKDDEHSTKYQMMQVEHLRDHMHNVIESTNFQDLENHSYLNFHEIIRNKQEDQSEEKNEKHESIQDLKKTLSRAIAQ